MAGQWENRAGVILALGSVCCPYISELWALSLCWFIRYGQRSPGPAVLRALWDSFRGGNAHVLRGMLLPGVPSGCFQREWCPPCGQGKPG